MERLMFDIALVSCTADLVEKIKRALPHSNSRLTVFEDLSELRAMRSGEKFELMVVQHPHANVDEAVCDSYRQLLPKHTPTIAIISDEHRECSVALLNLGIDRCLPRSFDESHFSAVVRALTRRNQGLMTSVSQYGPLSFNHATKRVSILEREVDLTMRETQVLEIFLKKVGQIIAKEDFIEAMNLDDINLNKSVVEVYVHRLRKKIRSELLPIRNIKRCGYFLRRYDALEEGKTYARTQLGRGMSL